jgi:hypothetical protein
MNVRVFLAGVLGGILTTALLRYPLYNYLPGLAGAEWPPASGGLAYGLLAAALLALLLTGVLGARLSGRQGRAAGAAAGAWAGLVAALPAYMWFGTAAAGVWGGRSLVAFGLHAPATEAEAMRLLIDTVVGTVVWTYGALWLTVAGGVILGGIGGLLVGAGGARQKDLPGLWSVVSVAGLLTMVLNGVVVVTVFALLGTQAQAAAAKIDYTPAIAPGWILVVALLTALAPLLAWQVVGIVSLHGISRSGGQAPIGLKPTAWVLGLLPFILVVFLALVGWSALLNLFFAPVILAALALGGYTLWKFAWRKAAPVTDQATPTGAAARPAKAVSAELITWTTALTGSAMISGLYFGTSPAALNLVLLAVTSISALLPTPETAAPTQTMAELVQSMYTIQANVAAYGILAVAILTALVGVAAWLIRRWQLSRRPA